MSYYGTVYRVLISSPSDIAEERLVVRDVIDHWNTTYSEKQGVILKPVLWEKDTIPEWGSAPQEIINKQLDIDTCDLAVALFGSSIGTKTNEAISGTLEEVQKFDNANKPVLLYLSPSIKEDERLDAIKKDRLYWWDFNSISEIREKLFSHLTVVVDEKLVEHKKKRLQLQAAIEKNQFLEEIVTRINEFETLSQRCTEKNPLLKRAMAKYFWKHYFIEIARNDVKGLFFESGSTIAYLSSEFRNGLNNSRSIKEYRNKFIIRTNNILTYLQFILFENINIDLIPHGPPENIYGATFGEIGPLPEDDPPSEGETTAPLNELVKPVVFNISPRLLPYDSPSLLLGTASGLELKGDAVFPGPHVGSYYNKLFKRAMLGSPHPLMFFLDSRKISPLSDDGKFIFGRCHPVCDDKDMWTHLYKSAPLAFCIGADNVENFNQIKELFSQLDFEDFNSAKEVDGYFVGVFQNKSFREKLGKRVDVRL